jgi:hypothetical protein
MVHTDLERMWKDLVVASLKDLSHISGGADKNHENIYQDSWCTGQDLNQAPPTLKSEALQLETTMLDATVSFLYKQCSKTDFVFL